MSVIFHIGTDQLSFLLPLGHTYDGNWSIIIWSIADDFRSGSSRWRMSTSTVTYEWSWAPDNKLEPRKIGIPQNSICPFQAITENTCFNLCHRWSHRKVSALVTFCISQFVLPFISIKTGFVCDLYEYFLRISDILNTLTAAEISQKN